jgi:GntR family transcriptional regulator/MocR family aminotransferase
MDLHVTFRRDGSRSLREQLEAQLRDGVRAGRLRPGTALPPSRTLARELGVSRGVVVEAYAQLVAEGFLVARRGAGTRVARGAAGAAPAAPLAAPAQPDRPAAAPPDRLLAAAPHAAAARPATLAAAAASPAYDLRTGRPDLAGFPRAAWQAATVRALRAMPHAALGYGDPRGAAELRLALAEHLGRARGVVADPAGIVVTSGVTQGLALVWAALRERGVRRVAIEDPGWRVQRLSVQDAGLEAVPVPVDDHGLDVAALRDSGAHAVVVTPAHHFPTGVVLAPGRRAALAAWAAETGGVIVEDDYDAEYRYDREPVGALQGLAPEHVVYAGSASKTLAPGLRLGWLVLPAALAPAVAEQRHRADQGGPVLGELALAELLRRGAVDRHLRRTRRRYRARRDALLGALAGELPDVRVGGVAAGLHLVAWLPDDVDEAALAGAAAARGVAVHALHADCTVVAPRPGALLLGYALLPEPALQRAAALLAAARIPATLCVRTPDADAASVSDASPRG